MATNFIVILFQRQHFGNEQGTFNDIEPNVPFVGPTKDFSFNCPNVDPGEPAFLMFQSRDVDHQRNVFQINGVDVFGGISASPDRDTWNGNILLIEPRHQLRATGNVLHVRSRNSSGGSGGNIDDFIIDNVVIVYKTRGSVVSGVAPYIDLREAPFSVVANDSSPAVVAQNTAGINLAIATYSGTGANLVLPNGDIFVEEQAPGGAEIRWCIKFGTGVSRLTLSGQGMFATTLVQLCEGDFGELNLLNIDGASYIELTNLGFRQDMITNPDPGQQNHLVAVYNNTLGGTTEHIRGHNLFFGKCIGDAIRILANDPSDHVVDAKFTNFLMVLNGVVTSVPPNGRTGARSGIAIQRGGIDCEFGNFYIAGAQNSAIDEEPSGGASSRTYFHDFQIDNALGNTGTPVSLGGSGGGDIAYDGRMHDGYIKGGNLTMLGPTSGYKLERLTIETTTPVAGATSTVTDPIGIGRPHRSGTKRHHDQADRNQRRWQLSRYHQHRQPDYDPKPLRRARSRREPSGHRRGDAPQLRGLSPAVPRRGTRSRHGVLVQTINADAEISESPMSTSFRARASSRPLLPWPSGTLDRWLESRSPTSDRRALRATACTCRLTRPEERPIEPQRSPDRRTDAIRSDADGSERQPDNHGVPDHFWQPRRHLYVRRGGDT